MGDDGDRDEPRHNELPGFSYDLWGVGGYRNYECSLDERDESVVKYDNDLYHILISEWLLDTGADVHVMTMVEWRRLG